MRSSVQYDTFSTLIQSLMAEIDVYQNQYQALCEDQDVRLVALVQPWLARTEETKQVLSQVETMASSLE